MWILELSLDDSDDSYWLLLVVNPFFILFSKSLDRKHFHLALAFACTGLGGTRTWMKMEGVETFGDDMIKKPHALRNPSYTYIYIYTHIYIYIYCILHHSNICKIPFQDSSYILTFKQNLKPAYLSLSPPNHLFHRSICRIRKWIPIGHGSEMIISHWGKIAIDVGWMV